jgi:hypothetical protein
MKFNTKNLVIELRLVLILRYCSPTHFQSRFIIGCFCSLHVTYDVVSSDLPHCDISGDQVRDMILIVTTMEYNIQQ